MKNFNLGCYLVMVGAEQVSSSDSSYLPSVTVGYIVSQTHLVLFMPPAWKVRRGHLVIGSSVCPSVCLSVRNSIPLTNKVQYLKFGWSYSNQTWTLVHLWVPHTTLTSHAPGEWAGSKCRTYRFLPYFDFVAAGGIRVSQTHVLFLVFNPFLKFYFIIWHGSLQGRVKRNCVKIPCIIIPFFASFLPWFVI